MITQIEPYLDRGFSRQTFSVVDMGVKEEAEADEPEIISEACMEARSLLSMRKATIVAIGATSSMVSSLLIDEVHDFLRLSKQLLELECHLIETEHAFLDTVLHEMNHEEKIRTIYNLIDSKEDNSLDVEEIHGIKVVCS